MRLAVILPSRGLIFSATVEEVLREVLSVGCQWRVFFSHSRPIPECFNEPLTQALDAGFDLFWIVEEDMALPAGVLSDLIDAGVSAAACDYPVTASGVMSVARDRDGRVLYTGTGCLLLDRDALEAVLPLTTSVQYVARGDAWERVDGDPGASAYGLHEVHLGMALYDRGTPIRVIGTTCDQRVITRRAAEKSNANGWHDIATLGGI